MIAFENKFPEILQWLIDDYRQKFKILYLRVNYNSMVAIIFNHLNITTDSDEFVTLNHMEASILASRDLLCVP